MRLAVFVGYHYWELATSANKNQGHWGGTGRPPATRFKGETTGAMRLYPAALLKTLPPAILLCAVYIGRPYMDDLGSDSRVILNNLAYLFCLVAVLMAYQFNRSRLMLASFGVAAFYWAVQRYLQISLSQADAARSYLAMSLALPILTLYLLLLPERGIWNLYGFVFSLAFVLLGLICLQLGPWLPEVNDAAGVYYAPHPSEGYVLSFGATLLVVLVALVGVALLCVRNEEVEAALMGAFLSLYLVLALLHVEHISVVMCTASALCLVWGLIRSSYAMAYRDELTGLPGRRALNERLQMLGGNFTLAMLDVDHFKRFNDTYGHDVGDEVLKLVASRMRRVGGGGTAYRYGGEEFCIVFPRRTVEDAVEPLERVREEIANYVMSIRDRNLRPARAKEGTRRRGATRLGSDQVSVTISAGVAARSAELPDTDAVIAAADKKLYQAKKAGRNRLAY
jgi:diguanylate cyclase (GGDEF)-like protein